MAGREDIPESGCNPPESTQRMLDNLNQMLFGDDSSYSNERPEVKASGMYVLAEVLHGLNVLNDTEDKAKTLEVVSKLPPTLDEIMAAFASSGIPDVRIDKLYTATTVSRRNRTKIHYYVKFSTEGQASYVADVGEIKAAPGCSGFKFFFPSTLHPA
jgi:hypothetical protein